MVMDNETYMEKVREHLDNNVKESYLKVAMQAED